MIAYVQRKDLDVNKYNACVENAQQSRIYAFSWYLDVVAENWDVLVFKDYEAVMPIPWKRKFGIKYVAQPYFCQQLGVFTKKELNKKNFLKCIPKTFLKLHLNINFNVDSLSLKERFNYELNLNKDYNAIYSNYRKDRKKSLKKSEKNDLYYRDVNNKDTLIALYQEVFGHLNLEAKYFETISNIIDFAFKKNYGFIRNVFFKETLVCSGLFLKNENRLYYIFASSSELGKKFGATTFILDSVIREYSNSKYVLDFEGSTIPSISSFYKSFGSLKTTYYTYQTNAFKRIFF